MPNRNKLSGTGYEYRIMANHKGHTGGIRSYSSQGLFDCCFIDEKGKSYLVQAKFTTQKKLKLPYISPDEILDIEIWVDQNCMKGVNEKNCFIGYFLKKAYGDEKRVQINSKKYKYQHLKT